MKSRNNITIQIQGPITLSVPPLVIEEILGPGRADALATRLIQLLGATSSAEPEPAYEVEPFREPTQKEYEAHRSSGAPTTGEMIQWIRNRQSPFDVADLAADVLGLTREEVKSRFLSKKTLSSGKVVNRASSFKTVCNLHLNEALDVLELESIVMEKPARKPQDLQCYVPTPRLEHWSS